MWINRKSLNKRNKWMQQDNQVLYWAMISLSIACSQLHSYWVLRMNMKLAKYSSKWVFLHLLNLALKMPCLMSWCICTDHRFLSMKNLKENAELAYSAYLLLKERTISSSRSIYLTVRWREMSLQLMIWNNWWVNTSSFKVRWRRLLRVTPQGRTEVSLWPQL